MRPVLIVVEGGIAGVRYCPQGIVVITKDYDTDGMRPENLRRDPPDPRPGDQFGLSIDKHKHARSKRALAEAWRIMKEERIR
jgi:hypothetical protein